MQTNFLEALARLAKLTAQIKDYSNRVPGLQYATVTAIDETKRMIQVSREAQGGQAHSDFFMAGRRSPFEDEPLPPIGTTVVIGCINGDPHDLVLLRTIANATNPPDITQAKPKDDLTTEIPGDERRAVTGNVFAAVQGERTEEVEKDFSLSCRGQTLTIEATEGNIEILALGVASEALMSGGSQAIVRGSQLVRLENASGTYIQMAGGALTMGNSVGQFWQLGQSGGLTNLVWDLGGQSVQIINCSGFSINGLQVATVTAVDSRGDALVTKGWA